MKTIEKIKTFITNNKLSLYRYDLFALKSEEKEKFLDRKFYIIDSVKGSDVILKNIENNKKLVLNNSEIFEMCLIYHFLDEDSVLKVKNLLKLSKNKDVTFYYITSKNGQQQRTKYKILKGTDVKNGELKVKVLFDDMESDYSFIIQTLDGEIKIVDK